MPRPRDFPSILLFFRTKHILIFNFIDGSFLVFPFDLASICWIGSRPRTAFPFLLKVHWVYSFQISTDSETKLTSKGRWTFEWSHNPFQLTLLIDDNRFLLSRKPIADESGLETGNIHIFFFTDRFLFPEDLHFSWRGTPECRFFYNVLDCLTPLRLRFHSTVWVQESKTRIETGLLWKHPLVWVQRHPTLLSRTVHNYARLIRVV